MKIKKFPQSCLLITSKSGATILVDPGKINYEEKFLKDWSKANAILVTHKHGDHFYPAAVKTIKAPLYSTQEVQNTYPDFKFKVIKEGDKFKVKDFKITVVKAIHGFLPKMKKGGQVFENVGYIVEADGVTLYITSDTICFNNDYKADYLFAPATGYGITMSAYETALYTKEVGAKKLIICHQDNIADYPVDLSFIETNMKANKIKYTIPKIGQSIELK